MTHNTTASWDLGPGVPGLVSVVIPTHNRADLLRQALESVSAQRHGSVEAIVVDDGSGDGTKGVVAQFPHIRYVVQHHQGAPVARNTGVVASSGEFIQFLDSDDLLSSGKLEEQVAYLSEHPLAQVVYGDGYRFRHPDPRDITSTVTGAPRCRIRWHLACLRALCHPSQCLWRRSEVQRIGPWDARLIRGQDWDYQLRSLVCGEGQERFAYEPGAPARFRHGAYGSITSPLAPDHGAIAANSLYLLAKAARVLARAGQANPLNVGALCMRCLDLAHGFFRRGYPNHAEAHMALADEIAASWAVPGPTGSLIRMGRGARWPLRWGIIGLATIARTAAQRIAMSIGVA